MTAQIKDSPKIDGRKWEIKFWDGDAHCIPPNESLGFRTICRATCNWSGRINHFLVHRGQLLLFKIQVSLDPEDKGILPFGARREILVRYDQLEHWGNDGMKMIQEPREYEYLVFDDLAITFSGTLALTFPYFDYWEVPWPIENGDDDTQLRAEATFEDGLLVEWTEQQI